MFILYQNSNCWISRGWWADISQNLQNVISLVDKKAMLNSFQLIFLNIWNEEKSISQLIQRGDWTSDKVKRQAGAELCQAQVKLVVIVDVVEEAWSWRCLKLFWSWSCILHSRSNSVLLWVVGGWLGGWGCWEYMKLKMSLAILSLKFFSKHRVGISILD